MTKIVNLDSKGKVNRAVISKFGEHLYHNPEVKRIMIRVEFKDGSNIGFKRDEDEDDFGELSQELDYSILMAEAKEIGFKRTKRGEKDRPNDLFQGKSNDIKIDMDEPKKILDYIRKRE